MTRFSAAAPPTADPFITGTVFGVMPDPNNFDTGDGLNTGRLPFQLAIEDHRAPAIVSARPQSH